MAVCVYSSSSSSWETGSWGTVPCSQLERTRPFSRCSRTSHLAAFTSAPFGPLRRQKPGRELSPLLPAGCGTCPGISSVLQTMSHRVAPGMLPPCRGFGAGRSSGTGPRQGPVPLSGEGKTQRASSALWEISLPAIQSRIPGGCLEEFSLIIIRIKAKGAQLSPWALACSQLPPVSPRRVRLIPHCCARLWAAADAGACCGACRAAARGPGSM